VAGSAQKFGGPWSIIKIETVASYLQRFNTALKNQDFQLVYIDAFAGSGGFQFSARRANPLFDEEEIVETHAGSARRALEVKPQFDRLVFVERDPRNLQALKRVLADHPHNNAQLLAGDANTEVQQLCQSINWGKTRGVIFLDPFGNSVEWATIEALAKSKLDVWYLFPLSGVYRNAPRDWAKLTPDKRAAITRILGSSDWETRFYEPPHDVMPNLFSLPTMPSRRSLNVDGIEEFIAERLGNVFPRVLPPRRLLGRTKAPMFSLFFGMANDSKRAWDVARPIAKHLLENG